MPRYTRRRPTAAAPSPSPSIFTIPTVRTRSTPRRTAHAASLIRLPQRLAGQTVERVGELPLNGRARHAHHVLFILKRSGRLPIQSKASNAPLRNVRDVRSILWAPLLVVRPKPIIIHIVYAPDAPAEVIHRSHIIQVITIGAHVTHVPELLRDVHR